MLKLNTGLCAIIVIAFGVCLVQTSPLLGANRCTWGPSYWCSNITNAKGCNAVRHCIQTVWEKQEVPVDNDSICKICKDMVGQARDQLRSNETMEELKEVFEGSCNLIPIKVVKKECSRLADDFIPELVEALSSQMNPDQVCTVAGLCNNAEIDKMLVEAYAGALDGSLKSEEVASSEEIDPMFSVKPRGLTCAKCNNIGSLIVSKFASVDRDEMLDHILRLCGEMSSFSDACSSIVLTYFNEIYDNMKQHLDAAGICHLSGVCSAQYHHHATPDEETASQMEIEVDTATAGGNDDIPCELCQQLVQHMRDVLIANTTESEFKQVMEGLCKQTKGFASECLSLVDQYYDVIYQTLVNDLDSKGACLMIGICPRGKQQPDQRFEIRPLLPVLPPAEIKVTIRKKLGANEPKFTQEELQQMALPIDHLMGAANPGLLVDGGQLCTICEYVLHFIQEELATPATEDEIKRTVNSICDKFPKAVRGECHNFVDMYGEAVIALLIQGLDPREICPKMQMCPQHHDNHDDMEVFAPKPIESQAQPEAETETEIESDKPTCPLCLFAVEQAQVKIKNDKSKKNIKNVLDHLCVHLPSKLQGECVDFVETYSSELVDMLITDFKPQEICVTLRLCEKSNNDLELMGISAEDSSSEEELDMTLNEIDGMSKSKSSSELIFRSEVTPPNCWMCEEIIKHTEKKINKHTSKEDIKRALERSCDRMRKELQPRCHKYIDRYGDKIATLILKEVEPKIVCRELGVCLSSELEDLDIDEAYKYDVIAMPERIVQEPPTCVLCEFVMTKLEADLKNKTTQDEIKRSIENICHHMPKTVARSCDKFIEQYADAILMLIGTVPPQEICRRMQLCFAGLAAVNDEVVECGVCHGAVMALLPYFKEHSHDAAIHEQDMIGTACEDLPAKYYQICSEMLSIYGQSIFHLSQKSDVDEAHICAEVGKCFDHEKSGLAFAKLTAA